MSTTTSTTRTIYLHCPSLSKLLTFDVACFDGGLDLGAIARAFAILPTSLRLNGHFISRGANLVSSVTWHALLAFFTKRGFPTGNSPVDAVVVDGKLIDDGLIRINFDHGRCMNGVKKRTIDHSEEVDEICALGFKRKLNLDSSSIVKKRKMVHYDQGPSENALVSASAKDDFCSKRKLLVNDTNLPKRTRTEQYSFGEKSHLHKSREELGEQKFPIYLNDSTIQKKGMLSW